VGKFIQLARSELFSFWGTVLLVFLLLAMKGSVGEGQPTFFGSVINNYVEETSASVISYTQSQSQLAELSSTLTTNSDIGQGGQDASVTPAPINDNSIQAHNPTNPDYIETGSFRRNQVTEYTVQPGDLLSFIASDYGISVESIIWANQLKNSDSLTIGQTLKIPPISGVIHTVKKGDTLASIAKMYGGDEAKILEFNELPADGQLKLGDELVIPDGKIKNTYVAVNSGTSAKTSSKAKPFSYLPDLGDYFMLPTNGYDWGKIHDRNGVDIANSCGTPVYAAADGTVAIADSSGYNGGFGKYIKLLHANGTETLYAHSMKLLVSVGETVSRGQEIMLMGTTGHSTGCHLHFEVHGARNPLAKY
jgi:murein DD-endopeptidase MepM/ murein hydrolase activator NlpD